LTATTVTGKLTNPAGTLPSRGAVAAVLIDYLNQPVVGFDPTDHTTILSTLPIPVNSDGTWTVALVPNASIQLANGSAQTAWRITETGGGADGSYPIIVPTGGPYWVGDLRTTLVGPAPSTTPTNLAVSGALTVGGTLTLDTVAVGAPPNDALKFLSGAGTWLTPGGGPPSGTAGGDLLGSSYPNPLLADSTHVHTIIDARVPTALPPIGSAGGDLTGTYPAPTLAATANVESIIRANRLDQFAAPTAAVDLNGHKLTGGAPGVASTDFATVSQLPTSTRDPNAAKLGLICQPFPVEAVDDTGLGLTAGFLILMLVRPGTATISNLGLWLGGAGSGASGVSSMALFDETGVRLAVTGDMTSALSNGANAGTYVEAALGSSYTTADATNYYVGVLCQMSPNPTIAGAFAGGVLHIPAIKGHRDAITFGSQSSMPASVTIASGNTAAAAYWLVGS
jgi:hypothetical protein